MLHLNLPQFINLYLSFIFQIGRGKCEPPKFPLCNGNKCVKWSSTYSSFYLFEFKSNANIDKVGTLMGKDVFNDDLKLHF